MYEVHLCVIRQIAMVRWVLGMGHCCCSYTALCHSVAHHESKSFRAHWHQWLLVSEHLLINPKSMPAAKGQTSVAHVCLHMQESACCVSKHSDSPLFKFFSRFITLLHSPCLGHGHRNLWGGQVGRMVLISTQFSVEVA